MTIFCPPTPYNILMHDVAIIGGGVIGLSIARELAKRLPQKAKSILLIERGAVGEGTSRAAAGMLSPQSEADEAGPFFSLCRESLEMFPAWHAELEQETGIDTMFSSNGVLALASSQEELHIFERRAAWQTKAGLRAELLSAGEALRMEPLLTASIAGALYLPSEISIAPRALTAALRESCLRRGVEIRTNVRVSSLADVSAHSIVVASGVWSGEIEGLDPPIPVYPRKGQILSLRMPPGSFRRMIRLGHSYFVPRPDGELVVGATNEDAGFDRSLTPAGIGRLLMDAQAISSHAASWPIQEMWTGLRPATPDELPIIGVSGKPGVFYAVGHYRNGVLLAPVTARIVANLIQGLPPGLSIGAYSPGRIV